MLTVGGVYNRLTANLGDFFGVTVEDPATYLTATDDVSYEFDPSAESDGQLVKELYVLEKIVI